MRIGHGYDTDRFAAGRPLILGDVAIPHDKGLLAHSDGDVVIHAPCDALLGAALGLLGGYSPPLLVGPAAMGFPGRNPSAMSRDDDFCAGVA